jgi:hypothetical protein
VARLHVEHVALIVCSPSSALKALTINTALASAKRNSYSRVSLVNCNRAAVTCSSAEIAMAMASKVRWNI